MPELPEVETIRRDLQYAVLGKGIRAVKVWTPRMIISGEKEFIKSLEGNRFEKIDRRGKLLVFHLAYGDKTLLIHLKMTGQLICQVPGGLIVGGHPSAKIENLPNDYTRAAFYLADGTILYFNDVRTFGYLKLADENETEECLKKFGLEPLTPEFTWSSFKELLAGRKGNLKAFLLNQSKIAGIGNIYADEICFRAKVRPERAIDSLDLSERRRLYNACQAVLKQAVEKRGTTFSNFVDASGKKGGFEKHLKVYNRAGLSCKRCKNGIIRKITAAGRGTHFCPECQK